MLAQNSSHSFILMVFKYIFFSALRLIKKRNENMHELLNLKSIYKRQILMEVTKEKKNIRI